MDDSRLKFATQNKPIQDKLTETTVTLSVPKSSKDDTGEYTLKLKNKYGEAEASVSNRILTMKLLFLCPFLNEIILDATGFPEPSVATGNRRVQGRHRACRRSILCNGKPS